MEQTAIESKLKELNYFIHDPSETYSPILKNVLDQFAIEKSNIFESSDLRPIEAQLRKSKPHVVSYLFDESHEKILSLIDQHKKIIPHKLERTFIVYSNSRKVNNFAQALEGEIDDYIVEPYSQDKISIKLKKVIHTKNNPSDLKVLLTDIENKIEKNDLIGAQANITAAMAIHPRPSIVYYHQARIDLKQNNIDQAIHHLITGLKFNKNHYRCLLLLHDTLVENKEFEKAYKVLKRTVENFPLSTQRILELIKNGISSEKFEEIEQYSSKILEMGTTDPGILLFSTSALLICATRAKEHGYTHSLNLIKKALKFSNNTPKILRNIFNLTLQFEEKKMYDKIITLFKDKKNSDYYFCEYMKELYEQSNYSDHIANLENRLENINYHEDYYNTLYKRANKHVSDKLKDKLEEIGRQFNYL